MKKQNLIALFLLLFIVGCFKQPERKAILVKINDYELTQREFEEEFKNSIYGSNNTVESRKDFLNSLINRKLILQDAQEQGLDKEKAFLKTIEKFWEQSLLKIALDKKTKDITGTVSVSDELIKEVYNKMLESGKTTKTLEQMREQIKWELIRLKESQLMNDWMDQLHKKAQIKINYDLLKQDKGG